MCEYVCMHLGVYIQVHACKYTFVCRQQDLYEYILHTLRSSLFQYVHIPLVYVFACVLKETNVACIPLIILHSTQSFVCMVCYFITHCKHMCVTF